MIRDRFFALAIGVAVMALPAAAHDTRPAEPTQVSEAYIPMTLSDRRPLYGHAPGNVRAQDMAELLGDRVVIIDASRRMRLVKRLPNHAITVSFLGRNGRYVWCTAGHIFGGSHEAARYRAPQGTVWSPVQVRHDHRLRPLIHGDITRPDRGFLSQLYDGGTGQVVHYSYQKGRWQVWEYGHLQTRLPRAVYTLCPDFPSPAELGIGVNEAQTAVTYDALLAQHPGTRVLRPDLVTPDPTEPAPPGAQSIRLPLSEPLWTGAAIKQQAAREAEQRRLQQRRDEIDAEGQGR